MIKYFTGDNAEENNILINAMMNAAKEYLNIVGRNDFDTNIINEWLNNEPIMLAINRLSIHLKIINEYK